MDIMNIMNINRVIIILLIVALLYALYKYQQKIISNTSSLLNLTNDKGDVKKIKHEKKKQKKETDNDLISIDNVSQISIGSLLDVDTTYNKKKGSYKKASIVDSLDSGNDSIASLLDDSNESFFFQQ